VELRGRTSRRTRGLGVLVGHTDAVYGALELMNGTFLSWSEDGTLRLWSAQGEFLKTFTGHTNSVSGVLELNDDRLLSWSADRTLRFWYPDTEAFIAYACTRVFRDFTDEERARYGLDDTPTCEHFGPLPTAGA